MTDNLKRLEEESKIRQKLEEIEMLINTMRITSEMYSEQSPNSKSFDNVEIYR